MSDAEKATRAASEAAPWIKLRRVIIADAMMALLCFTCQSDRCVEVTGTPALVARGAYFNGKRHVIKNIAMA
jgi:hypothetical protein